MQWFSKCSMCQNYLKGKHKISGFYPRFSSSEVRPRIRISDKFSDDGNAAGPGTTL